MLFDRPTCITKCNGFFWVGQTSNSIRKIPVTSASTTISTSNYVDGITCYKDTHIYFSEGHKIRKLDVNTLVITGLKKKLKK
jgi:hypothetical protein